MCPNSPAMLSLCPGHSCGVEVSPWLGQAGLELAPGHGKSQGAQRCLSSAPCHNGLGVPPGGLWKAFSFKVENICVFIMLLWVEGTYKAAIT